MAQITGHIFLADAAHVNRRTDGWTLITDVSVAFCFQGNGGVISFE